MPVKYFSCPAGDKVPTEECFNKCPRPEGRCLSLPFLMRAGENRPWRGKPSTTQLINGTRIAYLQILYDYTIDPQSMAFAVLGTRMHEKFDEIAKKINALSEEKLTGEVSGILDLLVPDQTTDIDCYELWDYKSWGSFKTAMALGLVGEKVIDPSGAKYQKAGKGFKAGDPKMITQWSRSLEAVDMYDAELQLNNYRIKIEELGFPVSKMYIQATVRDGGCISAKTRGVTALAYKIEVKRLDDEFTREYFKSKREALITALDTMQLPNVCNAKESWDGRRCKGFCSVVFWCPEGWEIYNAAQKEKEANGGN